VDYSRATGRATPAFYVLDHAAVIRHKWIGHPGEKAIDAALEKLIQEVEGENTPN